MEPVTWHGLSGGLAALRERRRRPLQRVEGTLNGSLVAIYNTRKNFKALKSRRPGPKLRNMKGVGSYQLSLDSRFQKPGIG